MDHVFEALHKIRSFFRVKNHHCCVLCLDDHSNTGEISILYFS